MERMAMASSITTGVLSTVPTPRMATCGWLMTGVREQAAEAAEIGDGERAALHFVGLELARAGARGQIDDGALQAQHVLLVGVADHRHDQAVFQRHRDADVDLVVVDDVVAVDARRSAAGTARSAATAARATNGR